MKNFPLQFHLIRYLLLQEINVHFICHANMKNRFAECNLFCNNFIFKISKLNVDIITSTLPAHVYNRIATNLDTDLCYTIRVALNNK